MMPVMPVLVETTTAGITQAICHGAGRRHKSCADFVVEVEVVNCKGDVKKITDLDVVRSTAGGLGLFGVVLSQVFFLDPMRVAVLRPERVPALLAVPPVKVEDVPNQGNFKADYGAGQLREAQERFYRECDSFYGEWFWFPFQKDCWVNVWDVEEKFDGQKPPEFLDEWSVIGQNALLALTSAFEKTLMRLLPGEIQARLMAALTLAVLPNGKTQRIGVPDAIHFQRGIHQLRVRDIELEIEIPGGPDGKPDFSICQSAWWAGINDIYEQQRRGKAPIRVALEVRIIGPSDVTLSSQRGKAHGVCSIEVLTNTQVGEREWSLFRDEISRRWEALVDPKSGKSLRIRPHWAKEWPEKMRGLKTIDYLKREYGSAAAEFRNHLSAVGREGGYSEEEAVRMFGNPTLLKILNIS
jgi:hypothetical protein